MAKKNWICVECQEEIVDTDYQMIAIEQPYTNVFFHRSCFKKVMNGVGDWKGLELYLAKNIKIWYN